MQEVERIKRRQTEKRADLLNSVNEAIKKKKMEMQLERKVRD